MVVDFCCKISRVILLYLGPAMVLVEADVMLVREVSLWSLDFSLFSFFFYNKWTPVMEFMEKLLIYLRSHPHWGVNDIPWWKPHQVTLTSKHLLALPIVKISKYFCTSCWFKPLGAPSLHPPALIQLPKSFLWGHLHSLSSKHLNR